MDNFDDALVMPRTLDDEKIAIVRTAFEEQHIKFNTLFRVTDENLEKYGIAQGGLRKSILAVLGK